MAEQTKTGTDAALMLSVSGCRGIVGETMTPDVAARFAWCAGRAFAEWSGDSSPTVVMGRDGRRGGEPLVAGAARGLAAAGCRVVDLGVATTPTVGVMVERLRAHGGLVLTASHNPAQWNGLKALAPSNVGGRCTAPEAARAQTIIDRFRAGDGPTAPASAGAPTRHDSAAQAHVDLVLRSIEPVAPVESIRARRFRVVTDSVNASGVAGARILLEALGCDLTMLHADSTGEFPHAPEPTEENLRGLCAEVSSRGANLGFAQDPDADRLAIIGPGGAYIGEEMTLAIAAMAVLPTAPRGASVAANLSTSRMLDDVAAGFGARVVRTAVGEANVASAMLRERCVIGGEGNGGVVWPDVVMIRDSLGAMALTLALLARDRIGLEEAVSRLPRYEIVKRKAPVRPGLAAAAGEAIAARWRKARIDRQDGVRIDLGSGEDACWAHVRASNTEPILRLIAEARTRERAESLLDEIAAVVASV